MRIRKQYKFECAHVVRNCYSERCKQNIHGHSYIVEAFFKPRPQQTGHYKLTGGSYVNDGKQNHYNFDSSEMVIDFSELVMIKQCVDLFDHTFVMYSGESSEFKHFFMENNKRWIILPFNSSAEIFALYFHWAFDKLLSEKTQSIIESNYDVDVDSVIVHETQTGYAQTEKNDLSNYAYSYMHAFKNTMYSTELIDESKPIINLLQKEND